MASNLGFSKHIWFYLIHKEKGVTLIPNPIGWREGNRTSKREKDHSISIEIGNSLEYYNEALTLLKDIRKEFGTDADVELLCEVRDSNSATKRKVAYRDYIDLSTLEYKDNKGKVKFRKKNLENILKSAKSSKIELEREETLIGTTATNLQTKDILIKGRTLFLESKLVSAIDPESNINPILRTPYSYDVENRRDTTGGNNVESRIAFPLDIKFTSHPDDVSSSSPDTQGGGLITSVRGNFYNTQLSNASFFTISEFDRTLNVKLDLSFDLDHGTSDEFISDKWSVILRRHPQSAISINEHYDEIVLFERLYTSTNYDDTIHIVEDLILDLKKGDTYSLHIHYKSILGSDAGDEWSRCNIAFKDSYISIEENNTTPERTRKTITAFNLGKRLVELITGNANHFHGPVLETGIWKNLTLSSGLWVRGFYGEFYGVDEDDIENPNDIQRIKTSLNDFINFCDTKLAVGVSFKLIDGIEKICFEPIKDKYRSRVLITLDEQPFDFSRKVSSDMLYTGVKFGDKFADVEDGVDLYEEIYGMSEYNTLSEWSTEFYKKENIYEKITVYRTDATGKTLALKKSIESYPNTDTRFDENIFVFHVKDIDATILEERTWQDDFQEPPKNIYSPDDATNLFFTPKQMFKRHSFLFNTELKKSIKYLSGRGNNSLSTLDNNGILTVENDDVNISETNRQLFFADEITFSTPYNEQIIKQINGQTNINGEEVLNVHGLIRFRNQEGHFEHGFINQIKEDDKIEFKIQAINPITKKI